MITINVTINDISGGQRYHSSACPVALSLSRHFKNSIHVFERSFRVSGSWKVYRLPGSAIDFISNFDNRFPTEPFSFEIEDQGGSNEDNRIS